MSIFKLVLNSFKYYLKANLLIAAGIIVTTAVITGALLVGDSMQHSLMQSVNYRLGNISHSITAGERLFTKDLAEKIESKTNYKTSQALMTRASGMIIGGEYQLENIQLWGIDNEFNNVYGSDFQFDSLENNEIVISENVAKRLMLNVGDKIMLRISKLNTTPANTPFVSDDLFLSKLFEVKSIEKDNGFGRLNACEAVKMAIEVKGIDVSGVVCGESDHNFDTDVPDAEVDDADAEHTDNDQEKYDGSIGEDDTFGDDEISRKKKDSGCSCSFLNI